MKKYLPEFKIKYSKSDRVEVAKLDNAEASAKYLHKLFNQDTIELTMQVIVVFTSATSETLGYHVLSEGGVNMIGVEPKTLFAIAVQAGATKFIIAHNKPSGSIVSSVSDKNLTKKLKKCGDIMNINLDDHLIVTKDVEKYYSFAEDGLI